MVPRFLLYQITVSGNLVILEKERDYKSQFLHGRFDTLISNESLLVLLCSKRGILHFIFDIWS